MAPSETKEYSQTSKELTEHPIQFSRSHRLNFQSNSIGNPKITSYVKEMKRKSKSLINLKTNLNYSIAPPPSEESWVTTGCLSTECLFYFVYGNNNISN